MISLSYMPVSSVPLPPRPRGKRTMWNASASSASESIMYPDISSMKKKMVQITTMVMIRDDLDHAMATS